MAVIAAAVSNDELRARLIRALNAAEYATTEALDGLEALRVAFEQQPDAMVIDVAIDEVDGLELVRMLRAASDIPIIAITPEGNPELSVQLLDLGADDVATYAAPSSEIVARVRATVRRAQRRTPSRPTDTVLVQTGDLVIDREAKIVTKFGAQVSLTRTEYRLLDALAARVGQMAPHRFLLSTVWGDAFVDDTHYLRVYIGYLRRKLEDDPKHPQYLINEWGMGYRLASLPTPSTEAAATPATPEPERSTSSSEPAEQSGATSADSAPE